MPETPAHIGSAGIPSPHIARAALHVAAIVDRSGSPASDAQESYWHHATGGTFAPSDLDRGQRLLVSLGLLVECNGKLMPTPDLTRMLEGSAEDAIALLCQRSVAGAAPGELDIPSVTTQLVELVPDAARREELLVALAQKFDDAWNSLVGDIGEELVVGEARAELTGMGYPDLARDVRRVSLLSDQLGYDVNAPRIVGSPRLLEVKATTSGTTQSSVTIHISRNEAETGTKYSDWALVVCLIEDVEQRVGRVAGWCGASVLADLLPSDGQSGRWEQASVELPLALLLPGLPGVVA